MAEVEEEEEEEEEVMMSLKSRTVASCHEGVTIMIVTAAATATREMQVVAAATATRELQPTVRRITSGLLSSGPLGSGMSWIICFPSLLLTSLAPPPPPPPPLPSLELKRSSSTRSLSSLAPP